MNHKKTDQKTWVRGLNYFLTARKHKPLPLHEVVARLDEILEAVFESDSDPETRADFNALLQARAVVANVEKMLSMKARDYAVEAAGVATPLQN